MGGDRAHADAVLGNLGARFHALAAWAIAPDLHLVIVEAQPVARAALDLAPPVPSHLRGRPLACEPRLIPIVPFCKLYYFGDPDLLRPFDDLSRQVIEQIATNSPIAEFLKGTTWEADEIASNLWPILMRDKLREWGAENLIRRWRWEVGGVPALLPYDDAELERWRVEEPRPAGPPPSKAVNVTWFLADIISTSASVLRTVIRDTFPHPATGSNAESCDDGRGGTAAAAEAGFVNPPTDPIANQDAPTRNPTVDQIVEVHNALWLFLNRLTTIVFPPLRQEDEVLAFFGLLADALRPVRPQIGQFEGWPHRIGRAVRVIAEGFDAIARLWGWEPLTRPEPERAAFAERCRSRYWETAERPFLEAALAWQEGCLGLDCPESVDEAAELARSRGLAPSMTPEEGQARYAEALIRLHTTPVFGQCLPTFRTTSQDDLKPLTEGFQVLHPEMLALAPERCRSLPKLYKDFAADLPLVVPTDSDGMPTVPPTEEQSSNLATLTPDDLVTLTQAAAIVHRSKRTLEKYKTKGLLPDPVVEGGAGKAAYYSWRTLRPWLQDEFKMLLPEIFPAKR